MPDIHQYATPYYTEVEFQVTSPSTNYDVDSNNATFHGKFGAGLFHGFANKAVIRTDQTITVKVNSTSNDAVTVTTTDSPFTLAGVEINNIFITNASGSTANVKILLTKVAA